MQKFREVLEQAVNMVFAPSTHTYAASADNLTTQQSIAESKQSETRSESREQTRAVVLEFDPSTHRLSVLLL